MDNTEEKKLKAEYDGSTAGKDPQNSAALSSLPGISNNAKAALNSIGSGGYVPSASVTSAMTELKNVIAKQPKEFQSKYYNQLSGVMNGILGRKEFTYDLAGDPMYRMYRDRYMSAGRQAMEDTMGQHAKLTGGYGSSYSATAGQQAYNRYLNALNDRIPELYEMSRSRYDAQGDALKQQYDMLNAAYQREYGAYQDEFDRWLKDRDAAYEAYRYEADADRAGYYNGLEHEKDMAQFEQKKADADRKYFYDLAMDMLDMGKTPSENILRSAGFSDEDIAAIIEKKPSSAKKKSSKKTSSSAKKSEGGTTSLDSLKSAASASGINAIKNKLQALKGR